MTWGVGTAFRLGVRVAEDGTRRGTVELTCRICGTIGQWAFADKPSPQHASKHFCRLGWQINERKRQAVCPACIRVVKTNVAAIAPGLVAPLTLKTETDTMTSTTTSTPRELTINQKAAVRLLLDKHFDDAAGQYLDGYTDQKIGAEASVPWASVKQLRELAYGPLREPAELEKLRADVKAFPDLVRRDVDVLRTVLLSSAGDLERRINELSKKLGHG